MPKTKKLTAKQKVFAECYIQSWNATLAAQQAGYKGSNQTLSSVGYENLRKPHISAEIKKRFEQIVMASDEVLARLAKMARGFDPTTYIVLKETYAMNSDGKEYFAGYSVGFDLEQLREDGFSSLIKKVRQSGKGVEIEWHDQFAALIQIGRHHKLFTDRVEHGLIDEWQPEVIAQIKAGEINYAQLAKEVGTTLAEELFKSAGVPITPS